MAFEGLTEKLQGALRKLSSKGKLTEDNVKEGMREVRMALLEADVNYAVAKDFIKKVTARCVGTEITGTLSASQQVIKIVNEEMTQLMGGENARLTWSSGPLTVYMLCGLQGAGKTTMAAKLANYLAKQGKKPMLAACDIYRPAAINQQGDAEGAFLRRQRRAARAEKADQQQTKRAFHAFSLLQSRAMVSTKSSSTPGTSDHAVKAVRTRQSRLMSNSCVSVSKPISA